MRAATWRHGKFDGSVKSPSVALHFAAQGLNVQEVRLVLARLVRLAYGAFYGSVRMLDAGCCSSSGIFSPAVHLSLIIGHRLGAMSRELLALMDPWTFLSETPSHGLPPHIPYSIRACRRPVSKKAVFNRTGLPASHEQEGHRRTRQGKVAIKSGKDRGGVPRVSRPPRLF